MKSTSPPVNPSLECSLIVHTHSPLPPPGTGRGQWAWLPAFLLAAYIPVRIRALSTMGMTLNAGVPFSIPIATNVYRLPLSSE